MNTMVEVSRTDLEALLKEVRESRETITRLQSTGTLNVLALRDLREVDKHRPGSSDRVMRFSRRMCLKLKANAHKGAWAKMSPPELLLCLRAEVGELESAIMTGRSPEEIASEAADVANFGMFLADHFGGLDNDPPMGG